MSDIYHKQIELHEAAARRESLSALSLAISSPRLVISTVIVEKVSPLATKKPMKVPSCPP